MRLIRLAILLAICCLVVGGCTRRTITITSEPDGALCWLNGREVGRTPVTVDFLYYGTYDVQLMAEGYEPLLTTGKADPPLWDHVPLDLVSEVTPPEKHAKIAWHYELLPPDDDPGELVNRARELRAQVASAPPVESVEQTADETPPTVQPR